MSGILTRYALRMTAGKRKLLGRFLIITKLFGFPRHSEVVSIRPPLIRANTYNRGIPYLERLLSLYLFHVPNCTQKAAGNSPAAFVACCALSRFCIAFTLLSVVTRITLRLRF